MRFTETKMATSPERLAELVAALEKLMGLTPDMKPKRLKAVVNDGEIVRDADVRVSPSDPNYKGSEEGVVKVRRRDFVTIRLDLWEEQQRAKRDDRLRRREIDPFRMGHWDDD